MFDSQTPRDVLSFVKDTINKDPKVTKKARMAALRAVGDFIKHAKGTPNVDRYAAGIKKGLWEVFAKETQSQEVRSHALMPLRQLLKLRPPSLAASKWEVSVMWDTIKEQYRIGSSKTSQEALPYRGILAVPRVATGNLTNLDDHHATCCAHRHRQRLLGF
ncbi:unnamed protein product [Sphacelaria rigidula]